MLIFALIRAIFNIENSTSINRVFMECDVIIRQAKDDYFARREHKGFTTPKTQIK